MFFLLSISKVLRQWQQRRHGNGKPGSYPFGPAGKESGAILLQRDDSPDFNDLSYDEALLDSELRLFFRSEYERVEPPAGAYDSVQFAIQREAQGAAHHAVEPRAAAGAATSTSAVLLRRIYRTLSGPAIVRIVPSGVAVALLVMILGANATQLLKGDAGRLIGVEISGPTPEEVLPAYEPTATLPRIVEQPVVAQPASSQSEVFFLDPVERRLPAYRPANREPDTRRNRNEY